MLTLEDLMRMDTGLALDETGSGFDPSNQMFYDEADMAGYAERAEVVSAPHTRWYYSSARTHLVARIVRDAVGGDGASVRRFAARELFDPLGMQHVVMEMDATGTPVGGHYLYAVVDGQRLLPGQGALVLGADAGHCLRRRLVDYAMMAVAGSMVESKKYFCAVNFLAL